MHHAQIYLILWISECLNRIAAPSARNWTVNEAKKQLTSAALDQFALPGDPGFPLNTLYAPPETRTDAGASPNDLLRRRHDC
jgi:actin related protein 2/3 complex subunit 3